MRYRTLGSSDPLIADLGFGASLLGGIDGTFAEQAGIAAAHSALDAGINFLYVSPSYKLTAVATVLGKALHGIGRARYPGTGRGLLLRVLVLACPACFLIGAAAKSALAAYQVHAGAAAKSALAAYGASSDKPEPP